MQQKYEQPIAQLQRQMDLLRKEYEYEKATFFEQTERMSVERRINQGICWYPVRSGRSSYNSLNQLVIDIERQDDPEQEHSFEYGKSVCFFAACSDGSFRFLNFSATISYVEDGRMVVALPSVQALSAIESCRDGLGVQLYFDETTYTTMFSALSETMRAKDNRLAHLRDVMLGQTPTQSAQLFPVSLPWLNHSQEKAVNRVLAAKEVAIVHGPPGTGKTTTLVEAIFETLQRENQVLVCAQSNTAVDNISEKLVDRGVSVLRVGNPTRVNDKMLSFTYERRFASHPDYHELWSIRKAMRELRSGMRKKSRQDRDTDRNRLSRLRFRATELEVKIDAELFGEARVVACTLVGSAHRVLMNHRFPTLFIDEAAQALEAACWIGIAKADRVVLAGDHHQLPPTIKCYEVERAGLGRTLMEKIVRRKPEVVTLLDMQYRMHDDIMRFSSHWFYDDKLHSAPDVSHRGILQYDTPIVWCDTADMDCDEDQREGSVSRINKKEAELLIEQLRSYINKISKERVLDESIDFGLISPYKAQVQYLRHLLKADSFFRPLRKLIAVHTVDGFQGQERDVVMISLVRANEEGRIGFLGDLRRMNVAMTRARMKLVIIGDSATLTKHPFYRELYEYIGKLKSKEESRQSDGEG